MNILDLFSPEELQAYALALKLEAMAFYLPPSEPFLASLVDGDLLSEWPLAPDDRYTQRGLELVRGSLTSAPVAGLVPRLRNDYMALFVGLEQVDAPPWESVYLSQDHLLFEEQTLEVRNAYAAYGLQIPKLDREPDDHIGFELLFLSHLLEQAAQAVADDDTPAVQDRLVAARDFLRSHPQQWVAEFAGRVDRFASDDYYRGLVFLLLGSLAGLDETLSAAFVTGGVQA